MFNVAPIEWLGYLASILIVVSLTMTDIIQLRIINTLGCICFVIYGLTVKAYPVALSNFIIILINFYNLYKLKSNK